MFVGIGLQSTGIAQVVPPTIKGKGQAGSDEVLELKLDSKLMERAMPYRVLLPRL